MSGDPEQAYFSDGITEDLITDLSKVSGLFVIARNSAFIYKGRAVDLREVSRELGVRYVLEGSVRKAGNRVRITAQLIDGATGGHLWAERYDREWTEVFTVRDQLTQQIVSALKVKLTADEGRSARRRGTDSIEAYEVFLRGREFLQLRTREGVELSRPLLEKAIDLDPAFAAAYAGLAFGYALEYVNCWTQAASHALGIALRLARKPWRWSPRNHRRITQWQWLISGGGSMKHQSERPLLPPICQRSAGRGPAMKIQARSSGLARSVRSRASLACTMFSKVAFRPTASACGSPPSLWTLPPVATSGPSATTARSMTSLPSRMR